MKFKLISHLLSGVPSNYIMLNPLTAEKFDLKPGTVLKSENKYVAFRVLTSISIPQGMAGVSPNKLNEANLDDGQEIELVPSGSEGVIRIIHKKIEGKTLTPTEISTFISALDSGSLTNSHIAAFGTAVQINGMRSEEVTSVAESILEHSKKMSPRGRIVVDKHSIGGIAGNRITPLMVPILAAAGLVVPKVSTRAITSPAGTVDVLEVVMPVDLNFEETCEVLDQTNGCMVNGQTVGLGAVADKFLAALKTIKIDPKEMMIASILAKKKAAGADFVLIDLPTGKGSKLETREEARALAYDFSRVGNKLGQRVECVISPGTTPIGSMIGPALEMTEVMIMLEGKRGDLALRRKATSLSGLILEAVKKANRGEGRSMASSIIKSGKGLQKLKEIIESQGGDPSITSEKIPVAPYSHIITAEKNDIVYSVENQSISSVARAAGCPADKMAGIILYVDRGDNIKPGDKLIEIRSHSESKLSEAIAMIKNTPPIILERSILEHITGVQE